MRLAGLIFVLAAAFAAPAAAQAIQEFRDCPDCPVMVRVPGGTFEMGSNDDLAGPVRSVTLKPFAVGKFEVSWDEFEACVRAGGCSLADQEKMSRGADSGFGKGNRPVIRMSWNDAKTYIAWINTRVAGAPYRLLSEAEWEYAARAGSKTAFQWGDEIGTGNAQCYGCGGPFDDSKTAPVGSFKPNAFGLYDMYGNVWEWVEDCVNSNYAGAPTDGSAWLSGDCSKRVIRGGSWNNNVHYQLATFRFQDAAGMRLSNFGIRVGRTLN